MAAERGTARSVVLAEENLVAKKFNGSAPSKKFEGSGAILRLSDFFQSGDALGGREASQPPLRRWRLERRRTPSPL